jgi:anti-anti-sigma regulatory factor
MGNTANDEDDEVLALPALLDLTAAEPLQRALLDRVRTGEPVIVAGAAVERVSAAAVQVLLAAAAESRARGNLFQLRDPSPALADALVDLGLAAHLGS